MHGAFVLGILALLFGTWVVYIIVEAFYYQEHLGKLLERDLGFRHGSPYVRCSGSACEVLTLEAITPGRIFDQAGFREGDIVKGLSITGFFKLLHKNRGKVVTVCVIDGGDGPPLEERPERLITFSVPAGEKISQSRPDGKGTLNNHPSLFAVFVNLTSPTTRNPTLNTR
jgi:hypothetical protein